MKILHLQLKAFGPFTDVELDLSAGEQGLHVVYGPNEAGKSSALRGLRQLLFGIPERTADAFLHPGPKLRLGATLANADGRQLEFWRRKGRKNTLLAADGKTSLDETTLRGWLAGLDEAQFTTAFGIDHAALIEGGEKIVQGHGELGTTLFAAGTGIANLREVLGGLESEADALFKPSGTKPAINARLSELKEAKRAMRDAQLPSAQWQQHENTLREATERLAEVDARLHDLSREKTRLTRIHDALPLIGRRQQLREKLAAVDDVPLLRDGFSEERSEAVSHLLAAKKTREDAQTAIKEIDAKIADLSVPEPLLAESESIERLHKGLSIHGKARADRSSLVAQRDQLLADARQQLAELRPELSLDDVEQLRLTRVEQLEIQNLGNRSEALQKERKTAKRTVETLQQTVRDCQNRLAELIVPPDVAPLKDALRRTQAAGDLEAQRAEATALLNRLQQQADVDLRKLGMFEAGLKDVERLSVPAVETVDRFEEQFAQVEQRRSLAAERRAKLAADADEIVKEISRLDEQGEVPHEHELKRARELRDLGWQLVREKLLGRSVDSGREYQFRQHFDTALSLDAAYEQAVRRADELADRLFKSAEKVARKTHLCSQQVSLRRQLATADDDFNTVEQQQEEFEESWVAVWQSTDIKPLPPREMRAWLTRHQRLVEQAETIRKQQSACESIQSRIATHREELRRQLAAIGSIAMEEDISLAALVAQAADEAARLDDLTLQRTQLAERQTQAQRDLDEAQRQASTADEELATWLSQWEKAVRPLGLDATATPAAANELLRQTEELFDRLNDAEKLALRIDGIDRDAEGFQQEVADVARRLDVAAEGQSWQQVAEDLVGRLRRATADQQRHETLLEQRTQREKVAMAATQTIDATNALLATLCQEAGCDGGDKLPEVERVSRTKAQLRNDLATCEEDLLRYAAGAALEEFVGAALAVDADELPQQLDTLTEEIQQLDAERQQLRETIGGEKREKARMDTAAIAAECAEKTERLVAELEPDVQQYLRLRLAATVLREGIERYRKKNEGPVLSRANELFAQLTLESFIGLRVDVDAKGEHSLVGVRPNGETVDPAGMSDGTCDQLYLALRLASLETWLDRNPAVPFLVDDVLISFDNERTAATLGVLAALSRRTQVILFTHHRHLVELAQRELDDELLFVQELARER